MVIKQSQTKVLIVDDDPFILDMYVLKFKELGYDISAAGDGKNALAKIRKEKPDIVLLDVVMPSMDGFEIMQEIQKDKPPHPKIIFLTNLGQKEDIEKGMRLGASDYVIKAHFTPSEVAEKVKAFVDKKGEIKR